MNTIKRYKNRKLYSTTESRYVTLKEILYAAAAGPLQVIDAVTGNDITTATLLGGAIATVNVETAKKMLDLALKSLPAVAEVSPTDVAGPGPKSLTL
jgi:polyhydroxyalkanoate synthesis regulator protein